MASNSSNESQLFVDGTLFDCTKVRYSAPKANASGGKAISIFSTVINSGLKVSTPLMLTWGASDYEGNKQYAMSLQFPSSEYLTADTEAFLRNMKALEEKIKADALTNSKEWFGKVHKSAEVIDALFTPMLKYPKDKQTRDFDYTKSPILSVKTPYYDGVWKFEVYDEDENKLHPNGANDLINPLDYLQKGTHLACIIQCGGLWFANGKFGITWRLAQAIVQKPKVSMEGQCFIKLKTADKEKLKALPPVEHDDIDPEGAVATIVEDSDDDEPAPTPTPAPVVKKEEPKVEEVKVEEKPVEKKKIVRKKTDA